MLIIKYNGIVLLLYVDICNRVFYMKNISDGWSYTFNVQWEVSIFIWLTIKLLSL